jgi:hypothetical protein
MIDLDSEWVRNGATLSDKTARKEFGLTQDEIVEAIRAGKLHYREASMHGNPWLRLLRREVEALVKKEMVRGRRGLCQGCGTWRGAAPTQDPLTDHGARVSEPHRPRRWRGRCVSSGVRQE